MRSFIVAVAVASCASAPASAPTPPPLTPAESPAPARAAGHSMCSCGNSACGAGCSVTCEADQRATCTCSSCEKDASLQAARCSCESASAAAGRESTPAPPDPSVTATPSSDLAPAHEAPFLADNSPSDGDDVRCPIPHSERAKPVGLPPRHRGTPLPFVPSPIERWRSALEGYVPRVRLNNQRTLGHERGICWAVYLTEMHKRIHPLFADSFLESLDRLPPGDPMNDTHLTVRLEVVLNRDGHIQQMGVVRSSGLTAFDVASLDSVDRAQPFGRAPDAIVSADGSVYLQWEFHRDEAQACSTMGARPYLLSSTP